MGLQNASKINKASSVCNSCRSLKTRCDRKNPCSTCAKRGLLLCTYPAFRKLGEAPLPGMGVFDPNFIDDTICPSTIAPSRKPDDTRDDFEVKQRRSMNDSELRASDQSVNPQKLDHFMSPTMGTRTPRNEPHGESIVATTGEAPTASPEAIFWPGSPGTYHAGPAMETPLLSEQARIERASGGSASIPLPHSPTSLAKDTGTQLERRPDSHGVQTNTPDEKIVNTPLELALGSKPWWDNGISSARRSIGDSYWRCGCPREDNIAFLCDETCRLNQECALYFARDLSFTQEAIVASLSVFAKQHTAAYTFYWSHQHGIWGTLESSDLISRNSFWTRQYHFSLNLVYEQLVKFPDVRFGRSNFERAGLLVAVIKLKDFCSPLSDKFGPSEIFRFEHAEDRTLLQNQVSTSERNSTPDPLDIDCGNTSR